MKDKELEEIVNDLHFKNWKTTHASNDSCVQEATQALEDLIAQERRKARQEGFDEAWAKNVQSSLCFMHEHDVRWCDECRGELKEDKEA